MQNAAIKQLVILATILADLTVIAQQAPVNSPLLDHLAGKWLLQGTVGKQPVTHDFDAEWVLQHHYLRFHEVGPLGWGTTVFFAVYCIVTAIGLYFGPRTPLVWFLIGLFYSVLAVTRRSFWMRCWITRFSGRAPYCTS